MTKAQVDRAHLIVLFDGDCNLCNGAINFLIDHDPHSTMRFASLQSEVAAKLLADATNVSTTDIDTVVAIDGAEILVRSDAAIRVAGRLGWPWKAAVAGKLIPRFIRDGVYRLVANNRHRLVRNARACRLPDEDRLSRFI